MVPVDLRIGNSEAGVAQAIGLRVAVVDTLGDDPPGWTGPPPLTAAELVDLIDHARHVHVSIMDWMPGLLPALAGTGRPVSTDLAPPVLRGSVCHVVDTPSA
jgi:hypothetical protein